jgi:hypothetical protein
MSKTAKSRSLGGWRPWRPWFGKVAKIILSKLLFLLKTAKAAKKMATCTPAREAGMAKAGKGAE